MPAKAMEFTPAQIIRMTVPGLSNKQLAREFGCSDMPIRRWRERNGITSTARPGARPRGYHAEGNHEQRPFKGPLGSPGRVDKDDESTVTTRPVLAAEVAAAGGAEAYLRETWGFAEDEWYCVSATGNQWEGPRAGGDTVTYAQVKGSFKPQRALADLIPAPAVWNGPMYSPGTPKRRGRTGIIETVVVMGDHQAPYHDVPLHEATLRLIEGMEPERIVHLGDLCDYTNISAHRDHAYVKAAVDECTQAGVDILASVREVAPTAAIDMLLGNHDVRPLVELLSRAERMAGIRVAKLPGESSRPELLNMRALWRLDDLGIALHESKRGWKHARVELVPGPRGLIVVHGHFTGPSVAAKTLAHFGRSVMMGHVHRPEHVFKWSQELECEQQAMVVGCQCLVRGEDGALFPDFVPNDRWLQGPAVVHIFADGEFTLERARWTGESLIVGGERF